MPTTPEDPRWIDDAVEAQEHRYDPGHYLGGRVHPLWPRAYRRFALWNDTVGYGWRLFIAGGLLALAIRGSNVPWSWEWPVLCLAAAVSAIGLLLVILQRGRRNGRG